MRSRATRWASRTLGTIVALGVAAAAWQLAPGTALAQDPALVPADADDEEAELGPEAGIRRPAAPDLRGGHWLLQPRFGLAVPFGSLATDLPASAIVGTGPSFGLNLGVGLNRYTVLEASGNYTLMTGSSRCGSCSGRSLDLGLGLVYHVAQGLAFDPWVSYGVGYRRSSFEGVAQTSRLVYEFSGDVFHGLDAARVGLGGDFYPLPWLGFGLFMEADVGTYLSRPAELGRSTYGVFQLGLRLALDPARRGLGVRTKAARGFPRTWAGAAGASKGGAVRPTSGI